MAVTNYAGLSQRTTAWAATEMLSHAEPILVLSKFGQCKPLPKNKADVVKFRRPNPFAISTTPLTEGVAPTAQALTYTDVTATLSQYGQVIDITDKVADLAEDPVLKDAATLAGEQAAETLELITWGAVKAGTNVGYSNGLARTAVNTAITLNGIRAGVRSLQAARGKQITQMLGGSPNYTTTPVEGGYVAFGHTDLAADLRSLVDGAGNNAFTPVANYGSRKPLSPYEVGSVENVRFILSPVLASFPNAGGLVNGMVSTGAVNADVYPLLICAKEGFGCVPLKGENSITPIVLQPDMPSKSDPLGQMGKVGWKSFFTATILNEAWMYRLECAATAI